jgi:maltose alpha-D-glucosyltransferase / alpha-amylase
MAAADERGLRVMLDLVVNHTSDQHPWFQHARSDPRSPFRDWYVWTDSEPANREIGMVFPGVQKRTWTYDDVARAWYHHRFYDFQPDLNTANPEVRREIRKILGFWQRLGVSGFRVDAAPFMIEHVRPGVEHGEPDFRLLTELREHLSWQRGDAVFLAEANVPAPELIRYTGDADGRASRLQMLFAFRLNEALMLALARRDARPLNAALLATPRLPNGGQWATFLRNHDEVDLSQLTSEERSDVLAAFGPERHHQLYERGIRRRLAPMLDGDQRRIRLAYSLQFTMRGTPVLRYGDEIGMGEDLALPERNAIRTPMQWDSTANAGFSTATAERLIRPVVRDERFGYKGLNVVVQRRDPESLLTWFQRMLDTLRECSEVGAGEHEVIHVESPQVVAHRAFTPRGSVLFVHNLGDRPVTVRLSHVGSDAEQLVDLFDDQDYGPVDLERVDIDAYGYRWIRLAENHSAPDPIAG